MDLSPSLQRTLMAALHIAQMFGYQLHTQSPPAHLLPLRPLLWKFTFWVFWMRNTRIYFDFQDPGWNFCLTKRWLLDSNGQHHSDFTLGPRIWLSGYNLPPTFSPLITSETLEKETIQIQIQIKMCQISLRSDLLRLWGKFYGFSR